MICMNFFEELQKSLVKLENELEPKALRQILEMNYSDIYLCHYGLGMCIRNNLLQEGSSLYQLFKECGMDDRDDISCILTEIFFVYIRTKYKEQARR